ncbi:MAG: 4Fe-4S ferredoxin [Verrucomicrobia bacterium]|nr:4Fe-4S ferredoxin [Verrucomicrobiota bacterium]
MAARHHIPGKMLRCGIGLLACAILAGSAGTALAVQRFPKPNFDSGYVLPQATTPAPRADYMQMVDVGVLFLALFLASYLALAKRSRRGMFLLGLFSILYFGFVRKGCVCSVGSIQNVVLALADGSYVVPLAVVVFFALPLLFTLLFGRTFCAAVCPLGAVQDVFVVRPVHVPAPIAALLGTIPYVYLGLGVLLAATGIDFIICRLDPFVSIFRMGGSFPILMLGVFFLVLGIFVARPYCRFMCPYGVLLGWMSRFSKFHVTITPDECIHCRLCEDACPFGAIKAPTPGTDPEPRKTGTRRLGLILVLLPLSVALGAWAGSRLDVPLSALNIKVRIAERVAMEDAGMVSGTTLESDSFRSTDQQNKEIFNESAALRRKLGMGGWLFGGFVGLVICSRLLGLSLHRTRKDYEPDRVTCLSCARCFMNCPKEHERLRRLGKTP